MKFGTKGFIKTHGFHNQPISGFTIKPNVHGPSLRSAVYRRPTSVVPQPWRKKVSTLSHVLVKIILFLRQKQKIVLEKLNTWKL